MTNKRAFASPEYQINDFTKRAFASPDYQTQDTKDALTI